MIVCEVDNWPIRHEHTLEARPREGHTMLPSYLALTSTTRNIALQNGMSRSRLIIRAQAADSPWLLGEIGFDGLLTWRTKLQRFVSEPALERVACGLVL